MNSIVSISLRVIIVMLSVFLALYALVTSAHGAPASPMIDIRNFGGVADGVTDNTPAVIAAIKSVDPTMSANHPPHGAVIYFPGAANRYLFKSPIPITSGIHIAGDGDASALQAHRDSPRLFEFTKDRMNQCRDWSVSDVTLWADDDDPTPPDAFAPPDSWTDSNRLDNPVCSVTVARVHAAGFRRVWDTDGAMLLDSTVRDLKVNRPKGEIVYHTFGGTNRYENINLEGANPREWVNDTVGMICVLDGSNYIAGCLIEGFGNRTSPPLYVIGGQGVTFRNNYSEVSGCVGGYAYLFRQGTIQIDRFNITPQPGGGVWFGDGCVAQIGVWSFPPWDDMKLSAKVEPTAFVQVQLLQTFNRPKNIPRNMVVDRKVTVAGGETATQAGTWRTWR